MRPDTPTHCPDCLAPIVVHVLSFYAPRTCPACGYGQADARTEGFRDLAGTLALAAGSAGMVVVGLVGLIFGSLQAQILGVLGVLGFILAVDRCLLAWEFLAQNRQSPPLAEIPGWCPPELAQTAPRPVARQEGLERPLHALIRMGVGIGALAAMAAWLPVAPWERRALIGFVATGVLLLAVRPLRITLEDWRHQRLVAHGRPALGNVLSVERPWFGGSRLRYRYLDEAGRAYEGKVWHPSAPPELPAGSAITVLYRHGAPSVSVPYPAGRYKVAHERTLAAG